jgi:hypothetical protein
MQPRKEGSVHTGAALLFCFVARMYPLLHLTFFMPSEDAE